MYAFQIEKYARLNAAAGDAGCGSIALLDVRRASFVVRYVIGRSGVSDEHIWVVQYILFFGNRTGKVY